MSQEREKLRSLWKPKEANERPTTQEFMQIRNAEQAKTAILELGRHRLSNPSRKDKRFSPEKIEEALEHIAHTFDYAVEKHKGKKRLTGEDYIFHPAAVTFKTLTDKHVLLEELTEAADTGLCHDVLEDTNTYPRELRDEIGENATRNVILLSKNMKVFDKSPENLHIELKKISYSGFTVDELALRKWAAKSHGSKLTRLHTHTDELFTAPALVRRVRINDRWHNLHTLPPLDITGRSPKDQAKVEKIWREIFSETEDFIRPIAISLGVAGFAIARELRSAYKEKKRQQ